MGYFKRKRSRRREGMLKEAARLGHLHGAAELGVTQPFEEWRFVRLSIPAWHWSSGKALGIFRVTGDVQRKMRLGEDLDGRIARALRWFNERLPVPRLRQPQAVFWFKFSAAECRRRVSRLARDLGTLGIEVVITETHAPGKLVYEDAFQVAAIPPASLTKTDAALV